MTFPAWIAAEVRGVGALAPTWWVLEGVGDRESGMPEWPVSRSCGGLLYIARCLHRII